jgi:hypothetical protein
VFFYANPFCKGLLYGRAGRLTALFGGFRPGQCTTSPAHRSSGSRWTWSSTSGSAGLAGAYTHPPHPRIESTRLAEYPPGFAATRRAPPSSAPSRARTASSGSATSRRRSRRTAGAGTRSTAATRPTAGGC